MRMKLARTYALIALLATAANIATQSIAFGMHGGVSGLYLSVMLGTAVGLVLKYALDKRFIFAFRARSRTDDLKTFLAYTTMGLGTTALFWGVEFAFWHLFETDAMRYAGGILGLVIGYWAKYGLDKHFVFRADRR
jgi:putative flippase GtrA